ncbi:hypothetical protein EUGRSUZ_J00998 [Eucalyptus grandis]|uniref:Uncharacterized protein n=2 Tax=Eucalyptus grandis TaxID=71139 RepID=A0ACC3J471_EUCGR|nr:hypothetical protein EUGRSUZ_J00998 [Eucalyptus grandis]
MPEKIFQCQSWQTYASLPLTMPMVKTNSFTYGNTCRSKSSIYILRGIKISILGFSEFGSDYNFLMCI